MFLQPQALDRIQTPLEGFMVKMIFDAPPVSARKEGFDIRALLEQGDQIEGVVGRTGPFVVAVKV
jgi:hypothetical protein